MALCRLLPNAEGVVWWPSDYTGQRGSPGPHPTPEPHLGGKTGVVTMEELADCPPKIPGNRWEELTIMAIYRLGPPGPLSGHPCRADLGPKSGPSCV